MSPEAGYLLAYQVVPRLSAVIRRSVLCIGVEDHEELIQDATCLAAKIMHNGELNGKQVRHFPLSTPSTAINTAVLW